MRFFPMRPAATTPPTAIMRSEEHTSELQSRSDLVCRLLLEKKKQRHRVTMRRKTTNNERRRRTGHARRTRTDTRNKRDTWPHSEPYPITPQRSTAPATQLCD